MREIELHIFNQMEVAVRDVDRAVGDAYFNIRDAYGLHFVLSEEELSDETTFEGYLTNAVESIKDTQRNIASMDKALAKLIALRLKLADETGIPFSPVGGKAFARLVEYSL